MKKQFNRGFTPLEISGKKISKIRKKKFLTGFTLVEILVYIAIFAIVILIVGYFIFWLVRTNNKAKAMREALNNAQRAMEAITYEIREAKSVYVPTTSQNQLSLETTKYLPEGESNSFIDFYLCSSRLCLKKESQNPVALTSNKATLSNLVFTEIISNSSSSIKIDLTVDYGAEASVTLNSTASPRTY